MIDNKMLDALNKQIVKEIYSSNAYLSMSGYFASTNLNGMARWMHQQAEEEMQHALKLFDYVLDRGGTPVIGAIEAPKSKWDSPLEVFEDALKHEEFITASINELVDLAISIKDHATNSMLQWFVDEQVEEEATTSQIVDKLKLINNAPGGLFMLDNELGNRNESE